MASPPRSGLRSSRARRARPDPPRSARHAMTTWSDLRVGAEQQLRAARVDAPDTEARWMVERVSGYDGVELVLGEHEPATAPAIAHLDDMFGASGRRRAVAVRARPLAVPRPRPARRPARAGAPPGDRGGGADRDRGSRPARGTAGCPRRRGRRARRSTRSPTSAPGRGRWRSAWLPSFPTPRCGPPT